jgi:hypothetical protein
MQIMKKLKRYCNIAALEPKRPSGPLLHGLRFSLDAPQGEGEDKSLHRAEAESLVVTIELEGVLIADDQVARSTAVLV